MQFTYESERDEKISFLDTLVMRVDGNLEFDVYRKPCSTRRVIVADSNQDMKHKMAAFHSMTHRLVKFPLSAKAYEKERLTILEIGRSNGYKMEAIDKIIRKHERKKQLLEYSTFYGLKKDRDDEEPIKISFPYYPKVTRALKPVYRNNKLEIVHRSSNSLRQHLGSLKDKIPELHKSGIYQIDCEEGCTYRYVGPLRKPVTRFNEHMVDWVNDQMEGSAVAARP